MMRVEGMKRFDDVMNEMTAARLRVVSINEVLKMVAKLPASYANGRAVVEVDDLISALLPTNKHEQLTLW